ncbi:hypothetical protein HY357_03670 [Candidatus Roizmanbacteria bacterium]|nr:hypothetical protein [Candidatus Roizmanbacteria bacterium]
MTNATIFILFFTDLWIVLYSSLLNFLNFRFPPSVTVKFYRPAVAFPEKFEIPLYLIMSFLFVVFIWVLHKYFHLFVTKRLPIVLKLIALVFLSLIFISKLGIYPLSNEIYPYQLRDDTSIYTIIILLYLASFLIIVCESMIMHAFFSRKPLLRVFLYTVVTIFIAIFIFEPHFPISPLEYGFFFGPIWDVVQGKTLFTDIPSQYGFLSILFLSALFKLGLFSFSYLPIYAFIMQVIEYFICFYLIYKVSKSTTLALIGLFSLITINYFSFYIFPLTIAQYGALRRLPFFLSLLLLYKLKKIDSPYFIFPFSLMSFWTVDSGIQMILAFGLSLFYLLIAQYISTKRVVKAIIMLFVSLTGIFVFLNILHILFAYKPINPFEIVTTIREYAISGVGMLPIETHTYFWLAILIYFASIIYFFRTINKPVQNGLRPFATILLFSANISLFASLYYVGRSDNASLIVISIFPLLNAFLLFAKAYSLISSLRTKLAISAVFFIFFIVVPTYERRHTLTELLIQKYNGWLKGNILRQELDQNLGKRFSREKQLINKHISADEALILSSDDTYLFYLTNKKNLLDENPQSGIESDLEMTYAVKNLEKKCPQKIAVDCSVVNKCPGFTPFTKGWLTAGYILKQAEVKCRTTYQPFDCTDQLCIAEAK